jgi:hypothetical protein
MGLVDKILETFKHWVNLEVEDFHDPDTEASRSIYKAAKKQHKAAIEANNTAKTLLEANPNNAQAKTLVSTTEKARKAARKAESKAKEEYDELAQRHNAKAASLNQQVEHVYRHTASKESSTMEENSMGCTAFASWTSPRRLYLVPMLVMVGSTEVLAVKDCVGY